MYRYACPVCHEERDEYRRIAERNDAPECHRRAMQRVLVAPMVAVFNPYTTAVYDKETGKPMRIRSQAEHRAFLTRNGFEEVGNDKSMAPPSPEEHAHRMSVKRKADAEARAQPDFAFDETTHEAAL